MTRIIVLAACLLLAAQVACLPDAHAAAATAADAPDGTAVTRSATLVEQGLVQDVSWRRHHHRHRRNRHWR